ncbi:MAG: EAL domain-containing protein [Clostridia bacterium]|nr:EAL domain-containing protein [Clostridia bacterium]
MASTEKFSFDRKTQEILEHISIPFAIYQYIDKRIVTIALSQGFCDEFGFKSLEDAYFAMNNDMYRATHPDDKTRVADAAYRFAAFDEPYDIVYRTRTLKDLDYIILHAYGKSIYPNGVRLCLTWYAYEGHFTPEQGTYGSILSQTLSQFLTEESQYRGMYYDYKTRLPNMAYFYELAEAGRKSMQAQGIGSAVLFFDLTGLKHFNRRYGFAEGDKLILEAAEILSRHFSSESCSRFAQDHFAAFAQEAGLTERLDAVIADFAEANGGKTLPIRIGVYPDRIEQVEIGLACDRARLAANARRKNKGSFYSIFDMDMMAAEQNRQEIIDNLDRAIEEGWIRVYYQPIVRSINGKVCDVEALARWQDPVRGLLAPSSFIPVLEEAMLIPKLDLYVVKQVLKDLKAYEQAGHRNVPISINFSRADFEACDLVQTICSMVDEAHVDRKLINIEITESIVGSDFGFIKEQIARFRAEGFQVWMDDFGSGYSSLEVLQSVRFDLIKFDMGFIRRLNEGDDGKIILTEMMKMATSLGLDTVCEGVETEEQARFLQEIGCSKLQGYYFLKPVPPERIFEKYTVEIKAGFENQRESAYYDTVGRVNLYDLSFLANMDDSVIKSTFDTVPMGIMEVSVDGGKVRYIRSNQSFRDFMKRAFQFDLSDPDLEYTVPKEGLGSSFMKAAEQCKAGSNRAFVDEEMADGSIVRSFMRKIGTNPANGKESYAIAVLSITEPDENPTYAEIAGALAADYYNIYLIDLDTNEFIEYTSQVGGEEMALERHGGDFFESARRDTMTRIYEEDRDPFLELFTKENVLRDIDRQGVFTTTYRLIDTGTPIYVNMKITRMKGRNRLILGVSIIDAHIQEKKRFERLQKERDLLIRVMALTDGYLTVSTVDPSTGYYIEYSAAENADSLGGSKDGNDFFGQLQKDAFTFCCDEDRQRFQEQVTRENVLSQVQAHGSFSINYRHIINGVPKPVTLKASLFKDGEENKLVLGVRVWKDRK